MLVPAEWRGRFDLDRQKESATARVLHLGGNRVVDIAPLARLTGLAELWFSANGVAYIEPLSRLARLSSLDLQGNEIGDLQSAVASPGGRPRSPDGPCRRPASVTTPRWTGRSRTTSAFRRICVRDRRASSPASTAGSPR